MTICDGCDLASGCKTVCMSPDISGMRATPEPGPDCVCDVMIVGEAPGHDEDLVGTPFVGASGTLLRTVVEDVGLDEFGIVYTNVVRCRPPNNAAPSAKQIKACTPKLLAEIERFGPTMVILLGNIPLKAVLGESGITAWRGSRLERDHVIYVPTFHPAYILRNNMELPTFVEDLQKVYDILSDNDNRSVVYEYDIRLVAGEADAKEMYEAILAACMVSWDTESRNSRPYATGSRMIMLSFAVDRPTKRAWAVLPDNAKVVAYCKKILCNENIKVICHNAKYDQHVVKQAWGIDVPNIVGDSMIASWVLDSTPGRHGLKHLAGRYLGMYEYNRELDVYHAQNPKSDPSKKGGDQSLVPVDILAPYAAMDAIATLELHKRLYKKMDPVQRTLYNQLFLPVSYALQRMEEWGVNIDLAIVQRYAKVYDAIRCRQYADLLELPVVKKFSKDRQSKLDKAYDVKYAGKTTRVKRPTFTFNPNSDLQMRELLFTKRYLGLEVLGKTEKGEASTKWEYLKPFANDNPFLHTYHYFSLMDKTLSTYIYPAVRWLDADGRVRSTYNVHGTSSGRLSSSDPNLQNIPTPEKEPDTVLSVLPVKNIFTASDWGDPGPELTAKYADLLGPYVSKGGLLLSADYSGMELRTMASTCHCQGMLDIFARGEDVHRIVSSAIFNVPIDQVTKEMRYAGKWTNWTLLYGGNEYVLQRLYGVPLDEGKRFVVAYYNMFPEILEYQKECVEFARDHGYIESMIGQRRYLPYINDNRNPKQRAHAEREAINHPIQSVASQMLLMVLIILDDLMYKHYQLRAKMVNTVHDEALFDTPLDEVPLVARLVTYTMENLPAIKQPWFPDIDLSWFICPLKAEVEVGSHYGSLVEYQLEE